MPLNFLELGIEKPDIDTMVERLHTNKGETIGAYYKLGAKDTRQIYELMLAPEQQSVPEPQPTPAETA